jgi:hypothetical protein
VGCPEENGLLQKYRRKLENIILKQILEKSCGILWIGLMCFVIVTSGGPCEHENGPASSSHKSLAKIISVWWLYHCTQLHGLGVASIGVLLCPQTYCTRCVTGHGAESTLQLTCLWGLWGLWLYPARRPFRNRAPCNRDYLANEVSFYFLPSTKMDGKASKFLDSLQVLARILLQSLLFSKSQLLP